MKYFFSFGFIFLFFISTGQSGVENLPKQVVQTMEKLFENEKILLTEKKLKENEFLIDKFYAIQSKKNNELKGYLHFGRVKTCRAGGCNAPEINPGEADSEFFDYFIIYSPELKIQIVKIFNYQASYGHEITARGWLKQFKGFTGEKSLEVGKNIDAISGATVSVYAITEDVQLKTRLLSELIN